MSCFEFALLLRTLRISPPLDIDEGEFREGLQRLAEVILQLHQVHGVAANQNSTAINHVAEKQISFRCHGTSLQQATDFNIF